jgi:hypothetical protein
MILDTCSDVDTSEEVCASTENTSACRGADRVEIESSGCSSFMTAGGGGGGTG